MDVGGVNSIALELMFAKVAINNLKTVQDIQKQVLQLLPEAGEEVREPAVANTSAEEAVEGTKGRLVNTFV